MTRARLTTDDHALLERVLTNEADMAFRRRVARAAGLAGAADGDHVFDCGCGMGFYLMAMRPAARPAPDGPGRRS